MSRIPILVLAAGASARMRGRDKLLEPVGGQPLIAERVAAALATGEAVIVALPPRDTAPGRWQALEGSGAQLVQVPDADEGMAASFRRAIAALPPDAAGMLVLLADMPEITTGDMRALLAGFDGDTILRGAAEDGTPGHPVLFPARDFPALSRLVGDQGARAVLDHEKSRVRRVPLPGAHALTDLDTPEDWALWRSQN